MKRSPQSIDHRPQSLPSANNVSSARGGWSIVYGLWSMVFFSLSGYAQSVSLPELLSNPAKFDNQTVQIQGELVGESLRSGEGVWVNILASEINIGVFAPHKSLLAGIHHWGSYQEKGDWVKITGVFYKQCLVHQAQDVHLRELQVLEPGRVTKDIIARYKIKLAAAFFIICLTTGLIYFIKVIYRKRK